MPSLSAGQWGKGIFIYMPARGDSLRRRQVEKRYRRGIAHGHKLPGEFESP